MKKSIFMDLNVDFLGLFKWTGQVGVAEMLTPIKKCNGDSI
jgi:hypothetical protein